MKEMTTIEMAGVMLAWDRGEALQFCDRIDVDTDREMWHSVCFLPSWNWERYIYKVVPADEVRIEKSSANTIVVRMPGGGTLNYTMDYNARNINKVMTSVTTNRYDGNTRAVHFIVDDEN